MSFNNPFAIIRTSLCYPFHHLLPLIHGENKPFACWLVISFHLAQKNKYGSSGCPWAHAIVFLYSTSTSTGCQGCFIIMNPSLTAKTCTLLESPKLAVHKKDIATYPFHLL